MDVNKMIMKIVDEQIGYFGLEERARQPLIEWARMLVGIGYELRKQESHVRKRVVQMTMDGEFVAFHESITEAANATGAERRNISDACRNKKKRNKKTTWIVRSAGGFKWKFAD